MRPACRQVRSAASRSPANTVEVTRCVIGETSTGPGHGPPSPTPERRPHGVVGQTATDKEEIHDSSTSGPIARLAINPSGYTGATPFGGREPGSNGFAFDPQGRLVLCERGDRRISRLEIDGRKTTLAGRYDGTRLNSPNDLVFNSNGDLYFTDPPCGLPKAFDDPQKSWAGAACIASRARAGSRC